MRYHARVSASSDIIRIHPEVADALAAGRAVVALESTVITHGLPAPDNLVLARQLEATVRAGGAVPATVALIGGVLKVGLSAAEMDFLASCQAHKASLWNLAWLCASGADAGTTVATTLHAAQLAGILVFATGGIGGVHHEPFDESADLLALASYPLVTVCAGPKSILNATATLERLETLGVPVIGYRSDMLAGFHVPQTDLPLAARCDEAGQLAACFLKQRQLGLKGGILVSNPVSAGLDPEALARWLTEAHKRAQAQVSGKDVTPFLLAQLAALSGGETVSVNLRLLNENAALAAEIAGALAKTPLAIV
jgi:pseudouridine-5'-phosphate glycosidase